MEGCALVFLLPPTLLSSLSPFLCFLPLPSSHFSFPSLSSFSTHFLSPLLLPSPLPPSSILKYITIGFSSASGHKQRPCGLVFVKTSSSEWFLHILKVWGKTSKPKTTKPKTYPKQSGLCRRDNNPRNLKYLLRSFAEKVCRALKYMIHIVFTCFFYFCWVWVLENVSLRRALNCIVFPLEEVTVSKGGSQHLSQRGHASCHGFCSSLPLKAVLWVQVEVGRARKTVVILVGVWHWFGL